MVSDANLLSLTSENTILSFAGWAHVRRATTSPINSIRFCDLFFVFSPPLNLFQIYLLDSSALGGPHSVRIQIPNIRFSQMPQVLCLHLQRHESLRKWNLCRLQCVISLRSFLRCVHQSSIRWQFHIYCMCHITNANIFEWIRLEYIFLCLCAHCMRPDEFTYYRDVDTNWLNWRIRYNNSVGEAESVQVYARIRWPAPASLRASSIRHQAHTDTSERTTEQLNNLITRSEYLYATRWWLSWLVGIDFIVRMLRPVMRQILVVDSPTNLCSVFIGRRLRCSSFRQCIRRVRSIDTNCDWIDKLYC